MAKQTCSPRMKKIEKTVHRIAPTDLTVLITGETGVGKGVLAKRIVALSDRKDQPFIQIDAAAIPESLLESELFGHQKGAFTDATSERQGHVERAHRGTLFFDEIGELSLEAQAKLLHIIQDGEYTTLGSNRSRRVDLRVIAATSRNLEAEVGQGTFRQDLYFRLNEIHLHLPPLRERKEDIPMLVRQFIRNFRDNYGDCKAPNLTPARLKLMQEYHWPGNIRELENFVKSLMVLGRESTAFSGLTSFKRPGRDPSPSEVPLPELVRRVEEAVERKLIKRTLERTGWHRKQTAAILHISYRSLLSKIKQFELIP